MKDKSIRMFTKPFSKEGFVLVYLGAIIVVGLLAYANSFTVPFQFDDARVILFAKDFFDKPWVLLLKFPLRSLVNYSFAIEYHYFKDSVFAYHLSNLAIHLVNSILVGYLFYSLVKSLLATTNNSLFKYAKYYSLFIALLFVSHPIQTQAVTYIIQRYASLATTWYLLGFLVYINTRKQWNLWWKERKKQLVISWGLILAFFCLGVLTKSTIFSLPATLIFSELVIYKKKFDVKFAFLTVLSPLLGLLFIYQTYQSLWFFSPKVSNQNEVITQASYLLTQTKVLPKYFQLLAVPVGQNIDHHIPVSQAVGMSELFGTIAIFALVFFSWKYRRKYPLLIFGIGWIFITLSIESSIIVLEDVIYEHRLYLPSFGFFVVVIWLIDRVITKRRDFVTSVSLLVLMVFVYTGLTIQRNQIWQTPLSLWADATRKSPAKSRPHLNYAVELQKKGLLDQASAEYKTTLLLDPKKYKALGNLASIYVIEKKYDLAKQLYSKSLEIEPDYLDAYVGLGVIEINSGDLQTAGSYFAKAKSIDSKSELVIKNLQLLDELLERPKYIPN